MRFIWLAIAVLGKDYAAAGSGISQGYKGIAHYDPLLKTQFYIESTIPCESSGVGIF